MEEALVQGLEGDAELLELECALVKGLESNKKLQGLVMVAH